MITAIILSGILVSMIGIQPVRADTDLHSDRYRFYFSPDAPRIDDREPIVRWLKNTSEKRYIGISNATRGRLERLVPAGDTFFMRYPGFLSNQMAANPETVRLFQMARLVNEYEETKKLLENAGERSNSDVLLKYRACTGISRAAFRSSHPQAVKDRCEYARRAMDLYENDQTGHPWLSDALFLMAMCLHDSRRNDRALDLLQKCLMLDESYLEAHWLMVKLLSIKFTSATVISSQFAYRHLGLLLKSLESITQLTRNQRDFHQLADRLRRFASSPYIRFVIGYCYLQAGDSDKSGNLFQELKDYPAENEAMYLIKKKSTALLQMMVSSKSKGSNIRK